MSAADPVEAPRAAVTTLAAEVLRLRNEYAETLGLRRLSSDVDRLRADLDELGDPRPGHRPAVDPSGIVEIPEDPYDQSTWADAQSETQHAQ